MLTIPSSRRTIAVLPSDQLCLLAARSTTFETPRETGRAPPDEANELLLLFVEVEERVLTTTMARTAIAATPPMTEPMIIPRVEEEEGGELDGGGDWLGNWMPERYAGDVTAPVVIKP